MIKSTTKKKEIVITVKEANLPSDYKVVARLKNGYALAVLKESLLSSKENRN